MVPAKQHLDQPHRATGTRAVGLSIVHPPEAARMPDLDGTPGEIIVHAIDGNLPDSLDGCDQLMQSVNAIGWMAQARICQHVRDNRLYTERFETFEACCNELWGWTPQHVGYLVSTAQTASRIEEISSTRPANAGQVKPLAKLPADEQADAWEEVVAESEQTGEKITARKVEQVVAKRVKKQPAKRSGALPEAEMLKVHLCSIVLDLNDPEATAQLIARNCDEGYLNDLVGFMQSHINRKA